MTVQLEPPGGGTRGMVGVTDLRTAYANRKETQTVKECWLARLPSGSRLLSQLESDDADRRLWKPCIAMEKKMGLFDNIRRAFTGKEPDRYKEMLRITTDLVIPAELVVRDKNQFKDVEYFRKKMYWSLGGARDALTIDKKTGHKHVDRVYLSSCAQDYVAFFKAAYTAGLPFEEIRRIVPEMLAALDYCDPIYREKVSIGVGHNHILNCRSWFFYAIAILPIVLALYGPGEEALHILRFTGEGGQDALYDRIAARIDQARVIGAKPIISQRYNMLLETMDLPPEERPARIRKFLSGWYSMVYKHSSGHNTHDSEAYSGYWSYETAAVVMLWDIDDSTFRDHKNYPDELVAYYRRGRQEKSSSRREAIHQNQDVLDSSAARPWAQTDASGNRA